MINVSRIKQLIEKECEGTTLDYKEDLNLQNDGDKAQFVKDVLSLANSGQTAHIIIGVEDGTRKLVGIKTHHRAEQLNQILRDKSGPPLRVEYVEKKIMGYTVGVIEIAGDNRPYIVAVPEKFGGPLSHSQGKFHIERGTVFVRNYNMNEGACRADLDRMYEVKYVTLQADLELSYEVSVKPLNNSKEVAIKFILANLGEIIATNTYVWIRFENVKELVQCEGHWTNVSAFNNNIPTVQRVFTTPIVPPLLLRSFRDKVVVKVDGDVQKIAAHVVIGATNMRTKSGPYVISLKESDKE